MMSQSTKCSLAQLKQQKWTLKQTEQLRQSLMQKAKQLKEKMYQQTNYYDYSINHLMNQTLKEIKKHKDQFKEKEHHIIQDDSNEQITHKKQLLKTQLIQNLQKCKNRYRKHISIIKNQRNRVYTDTKDQSPNGAQNVEEMLITAKNKFKKELRQKRNHSEIINLNNTKRFEPKKTQIKAYEPIDHKDYRKTPKLYKNLIKLNEDLTYILQDPSAFPKLNQDEIREICQYRENQRQIFGVISPMASKKEIFLSTNPSKKIYYSPYHRFPTQMRQTMNNTQIEILISQRSAFIPIGKVIRSERKELKIVSSKRNDGIGIKGENITGNKNKISVEIADDIQDVQQRNKDQKGRLEKESEESLESNRLLAKLTPKSLQRKPNRSKFLTQSSHLQSDKMSRLKAQKIRTSSIFDNIKGTRIVTELAPFVDSSFSKQVAQQQNEESKQIKIDEEITGKLSLSNSKVVNEARKDSFLLKATVVNKCLKSNGLSRGMIKNNKPRYQVEETRESNFEIDVENRKKLSRSINLDIKGNHLQLLNSLKLQKSHKQKSSESSWQNRMNTKCEL